DEVRAGWAAIVARQPRSTLVVLAVSLAGWALLAWLVFDMEHPLARLTMPGSSDWSIANVAAGWGMWAVMMAAMMLPAALAWIAALSMAVAVEKMVPGGGRVAGVLGVALIGTGLWRVTALLSL